jgi:iron complex transport system ATP-binding protein
MSLRCQDLGWSVRRRPIVEHISLDVREGETLGLIGANGSGKSTLLKMLAGIRAPGTGRVTLDGRDLSGYAQREIAQRIALVEQQAETGDRITVRDAVELGRTPWLSALRHWSDADEVSVSRAIAAVDMQGFETRQWNTLSGGERQRVHIARALAQDPKILLLDEPTNHLDIHHQLSILSLVARLPITSVVALHDLNQAMECDRLALLQNGRLVTLGTPEDVLTCDRLAESFAVHASILTDPADGARVLRFHKPA